MARISRDVLTALVLGPSNEGRLVSELPVRGDVWVGYEQAPGGSRRLLIETQRSVHTSSVAANIADRLYNENNVSTAHDGYGISFVEGYISLEVTLRDLVYKLIPMTEWLQDIVCGDNPVDVPREPFVGHVQWQLERLAGRGQHNPPEFEFDYRVSQLSSMFRVLAALFWLEHEESIERLRSNQESVESKAISNMSELLERAGSVLAVSAYELFSKVRDETVRYRDRDSSPYGEIFSISQDRPIELAVDRSVPAVKADAVRSLFSVSCEHIGWAVIDSGIDAEHTAFIDTNNKPRIKATYDFTRLSKVVQVDHLYNKNLLSKHAQEIVGWLQYKLPPGKIEEELLQLASDAQRERRIDWSLVEKYLKLDRPERPSLPHGTHVAGILGGGGIVDKHGKRTLCGMCPDIKLFDFRVITQSERDTEFALIGTLQFIRWLNERNNNPQIHGVNISLSIPHDVRNYACGRTPVCKESERLVNSGVVVVAAAGNRGYQSFNLSDGSSFDAYAPASITDPGNAEAVITVGSTHRYEPHNYGVSFFSSRGPTGDGRAKPDLVAPGEKIWSMVPVNSKSVMSGTSMAAPHVSGAAALLMARNCEFIGQATRIKQILCRSCTDLGREKEYQGAGMLDILRAMQSV